MKFSKQRNIIENIVVNNKKHYTVEEVYKLAKKKLPNLGLATVYRNLHLLSDEGIINKITLDNLERFDGDMSVHNHFICTNCNSIYDIDIDIKDAIDVDFIVNDYTLILRGICKKCFH